MIRIPEGFHEEVQRLCVQLKVPPATLTRILLEQYVSDHKANKGRMPWPPRFQYFDDAPIINAAEGAEGKGAFVSRIRQKTKGHTE